MDPHLLKLTVACVDVAMAAVSWLILLCTYPDFARWRSEGFAEAHEAYTRRVGWVVGPLLLAQLAGLGKSGSFARVADGGVDDLGRCFDSAGRGLTPLVGS